MINIKNKKDCCGCSACIQRCPKQCIKMIEDEEGFQYPKINLSLCINCNLCEKVCPMLHPIPTQSPKACYAAINKNEQIRLQSSSGGIFSLLAEQIINKKGIVFGACFDEKWEVKHNYTETLEGIAAFRGSKYIQSRIESNYLEAEKFLKQGKLVLFSGTPCQIAGLKGFLKKEYDNLITVDFICHGVPSPKIWRTYLETTCRHIINQNDKKNSINSSSTTSSNKSYIECINFRNKTTGWKKYSFLLKLKTHTTQDSKNAEEVCQIFSENTFMKGFIKCLYLRPSCYNCRTKGGKSGSDFTLGDFWGIQMLYPEWDDDKGTSAIFINTSKALSIFTNINKENIHSKQVSFNDIVYFNKSYKYSCSEPPFRVFFFKKYNKKNRIDDSLFQPTFKDRVILKFKKHFKL